MLDQLVVFEADLSVTGSPKVEVKGSELNIVNGCTSLNITKLRHLLDKSVRLLCSGHAVTLQKRKSWLKGYLDQRYHYLIRTTNPVTTDLLGPNLDQKISESNRVMEAARKIYSNRSRFSNPRTRFRGRAHLPGPDRQAWRDNRGTPAGSPNRQRRRDNKPYNRDNRPFNRGIPSTRGRSQPRRGRR